MEYKMENKVSKKNTENQTKGTSSRLSPSTRKKADRLLKIANKKDSGLKIKLDQLLNLSLDLVTEEHLKKLQNDSLKNSDRQEILRKKYSDIYGPVTEEEFIGITWTPTYYEFLKEHGQLLGI